jgi:hypothetical protein
MAHGRGCAEAKQHKCECAGCGGSEHGWSGRLALARESAEGRAAFRARADEAWARASKRKTTTPSGAKQAAGTDTAVADVVDWLAENRYAIDEVQQIGDALTGTVIGELDQSLGPVTRNRRMKAMTDHFWCDLLAAFACAISEFKQQIDKIPDRVTSAILESRDTDHRSIVEDIIVRLAVSATWKAIHKLSFFDQLDHLIRATRILGVLICKAPEQHPAVARCCLKPLTGGVISAATTERLMEIFPPDWLSDTRRSLSA